MAQICNLLKSVQVGPESGLCAQSHLPNLGATPGPPETPSQRVTPCQVQRKRSPMLSCPWLRAVNIRTMG